MFGYFGTGVIVVFRVMVLWITINNAYAQSLDFHQGDIFSKDSCSNCADEALDTKAIQGQQKRVDEKAKILIFINPGCSWCQKALRNIDVFKSRHPQLSIQVYVMGSAKEFIEFVHAELPRLPARLDYTLDFKNMMADSYGVRRTPTYIILNQGQTKKVEGYVDLNRSSVVAKS